MHIPEYESAATASPDDDRPVWGIASIATVIGRTKPQTRWMLRTGKLPGRYIGRRWVSTPRQLLHAIGVTTA
jgi:hypothetical protein